MTRKKTSREYLQISRVRFLIGLMGNTCWICVARKGNEIKRFKMDTSLEICNAG